MKIKLNYLAFSFLMSICILAILSYSFYRQLENLSRSNDMVDHTYRVIFYLYRADNNLKTAENNERAYLLTRDTSFYNTSQVAQDSVKKMLIILKDSTADNLVQQKNLSKLSAWIDVRLNYLYRNNSAKQHDTSFLKQNILLSENAVKQYNTVLINMRNEELRLMKERKEKKIFYENLTPDYLRTLFIFSFIIFILSFILIWREFQKSTEFRKQLERKVQELTRMSTALQDFSFVTSHNMQEPLRKILVFGNMLQTKYKNEFQQETQGLLGRINNAGLKMYELINDFTSFASLFNTSENISSVNLEEIIQKIRNGFPQNYPENKITLETGRLRTINGFNDQLNILFKCLIDNAIKFTKKEGEVIIKITDSETDWQDIADKDKSILKRKYYKISVKDNGIGFDNSFAKKIFKLFQRLDSVDNKGAKGLGLSIVEQIMFNHHGFATAEGVAGETACFNLFFPMEEK